MNTKIRVADHLPFQEIETRYRKAKDGTARGHWQVIWLIAQGTPAQHVAEMTSYSYTWVRTLVQRYNHDGPDALGDRRHGNAGGQLSCRLNSSSSYKKPWSMIHLMEDYGQDPRWPSGSLSKRVARSIPSWAGSICDASISASGCCVLAT